MTFDTMGTQDTREKFVNLRKRLDQLGYKQPLSLECLPLVERLFCDLVWTTESLRKAKTELISELNLRSNVEDYVSAYKADNGRLIHDNNQLHEQLLCLRQDMEEKTKTLQAECRRCEEENDYLKLLNSKCTEKIKEYETNAKHMAEQIRLLQEKNFEAAVCTQDGRKQQPPFRRQKMNIDTLVPQQKSDSNAYCCSTTKLRHLANTTEPQEINLSNLTSKRCEDLEKQLERLEEELALNKKKLDNFHHQVNLRDAEIVRLRALLEGSRPLDVVIQDSTEQKTDRMLQPCQTQFDSLRARNQELESHFVNTVNRENPGHISSTKNLPAVMCSVEVQTSSLVTQDQLDVSCQAEFRDQPCLTTIMDNMKHIQQLLSSIDSSRKSFMKTIDTLAKRGSKSIMNLSTKATNSRTSRLQDQEKSLDAMKEAYLKHIQSLESNSHHWRFEAQTLVAALRQLTEMFCNSHLIIGLLETQTPVHTASILRDLNSITSQTISRVPRRRSLTLPHGNYSRAKIERRSLSLDRSAESETIQLERDRYRQLLETARHSMRKCLQGRLKNLGLIQKPFSDSGDITIEVSRLRQERDNLHSLMGNFERQLSDIQSNVRVLTSERNQLYEQLEQSRKELSSTRDQLAKLEASRNVDSRSPHCFSTGATNTDQHQCFNSSPRSTHSLLLHLEHNRDQLADELRHMTNERDSLRDRLHDLTEKGLSEKAYLLQRLEDAEKELNDCRRTIDGDTRHSTEMGQRINTLETERRKLLDRIDCLEHSKANDRQLQMTERSLQTVQSRLDEVQLECESLREETIRLRRTLRQMDREKDTLQAALDERTERCATLESEFSKIQLQLHEYQKSSQTFEQRALRLSKSAVQKDAEFRELNGRAALLEVELKQTKEALEHAHRESQEIKNDLGAAVNETQNLCTQLRIESGKLSDLQNRLDASNAELALSKEVSSRIEQEKSDLLKQYRALTLELDSQTGSVGRLENQLKDVQHTCSAREQEATSLRRQLDSARNEIANYQEVVGTLESQCSLLSRTASESEERVRRLQSENEEVHREMSDLRALCDHLEHQSHLHQQFVTTSNLERDQLRAQLAEAEREVCGLRRQVDHEVGTIRNLEAILAASREEELKAQQSLQNHRMELQFTREKLEQRNKSLAQTELEVHNLRSQIASLKIRLNWPGTGVKRASRSYGDSSEHCMETNFSNISHHPATEEGNGISEAGHREPIPRLTDACASNSTAMHDDSPVDSLLADDVDFTELNFFEHCLEGDACFLTSAPNHTSASTMLPGLYHTGKKRLENPRGSRSSSPETGFATTDSTHTQRDVRDQSDSQATITAP